MYWISRWRCVLCRACIFALDLEHRLILPLRSSQGVKQVKKTDLGARFLFLSPPSLKILEERLRGRGTDDENSVKKRIEQAEREMAFAQEEGVHDRIVVNDDLKKAYEEVDEWIIDRGNFGGRI